MHVHVDTEEEWEDTVYSVSYCTQLSHHCMTFSNAVDSVTVSEVRVSKRPVCPYWKSCRNSPTHQHSVWHCQRKLHLLLDLHMDKVSHRVVEPCSTELIVAILSVSKTEVVLPH